MTGLGDKPSQKRMLTTRLGRPRLVGRLFCSILLVSLGQFSSADQYSTNEDDLKFAYLANFARFVQWEYAPEHVVVCLPQQSSLKKFVPKSKLLKVDEVTSLRFVMTDNLSATCNIFYWDVDAKHPKLRGESGKQIASVVTITDRAHGHERGFLVQFYLHDLKLRMSIDESRLEQCNFEISSKLLRLFRSLN